MRNIIQGPSPDGPVPRGPSEGVPKPRTDGPRGRSRVSFSVEPAQGASRRGRAKKGVLGWSTSAANTTARGNSRWGPSLPCFPETLARPTPMKWVVPKTPRASNTGIAQTGQSFGIRRRFWETGYRDSGAVSPYRAFPNQPRKLIGDRRALVIRWRGLVRTGPAKGDADSHAHTRAYRRPLPSHRPSR